MNAHVPAIVVDTAWLDNQTETVWLKEQAQATKRRSFSSFVRAILAAGGYVETFTFPEDKQAVFELASKPATESYDHELASKPATETYFSFIRRMLPGFGGGGGGGGSGSSSGADSSGRHQDQQSGGDSGSSSGQGTGQGDGSSTPGQGHPTSNSASGELLACTEHSLSLVSSAHHLEDNSWSEAHC